LPSDRILNEEDRVYSAMLKAVRHAHNLLRKNSAPFAAKARRSRLTK
jgi:hypothetical protein